MRARVSRTALLQSLEAVRGGLSPRDIVEQSSCFVFSGGRVMTYNSEVACQAKSLLPEGLTGAVQAEPLLAVLSKLQEDEVEISTAAGEFLVRGRRRRAGIRMESEVTLPLETVEKPGSWKKLPDDFAEAVKLVQECVSNDEAKFVMTCVHLHPKWVEASDNYQVFRYRTVTGLAGRALVRRDAIKHIVELGVTKVSETESWVHFRNRSGLVFSCRRYTDDYPNLGKTLKFSGEPMEIPRGLKDAAELAGIFTQETSRDDEILVDLSPGLVRVRGQGSAGWATEVKKLKYGGPRLQFNIGANLLAEIVGRHNECEITADRLKVNGGHWTYFTTLGTPDSNGADKKGKSDGNSE